MMWVVGPCHIFNCALEFALLLRKRPENLSQGSRLVLDTSTSRYDGLVAFLWATSSGLHAFPWVTSINPWHKCLPIFRNKVFSASDNFESKHSVNALM
jgi:hypothetical protein